MEKTDGYSFLPWVETISTGRVFIFQIFININEVKMNLKEWVKKELERDDVQRIAEIMEVTHSGATRGAFQIVAPDHLKDSVLNH